MKNICEFCVNILTKFTFFSFLIDAKKEECYTIFVKIVVKK